MSDVVERAKAALDEKCACCESEPCGWQEMTFAETCRALVPELVAEIERLRAHLAAVPSAIQGYAGCELTGYSYHGDGSAIEALKRLQREADGILAYAGTAQGARR
jgi:hypothetical protein